MTPYHFLHWFQHDAQCAFAMPETEEETIVKLWLLSRWAESLWVLCLWNPLGCLLPRSKIHLIFGFCVGIGGFQWPRPGRPFKASECILHCKDRKGWAWCPGLPIVQFIFATKQRKGGGGLDLLGLDGGLEPCANPASTKNLGAG